VIVLKDGESERCYEVPEVLAIGIEDGLKECLDRIDGATMT
jgi:hypothetical protein